MPVSPTEPLRKKTIKREDFVEAFVRQGMTYEAAINAFDAMVQTFENAVVNGQNVRIGKMCCLSAVKKPPRQVKSGFNGRTTFLGTRIVYKMRIFRGWMDSRRLNWQL